MKLREGDSIEWINNRPLMPVVRITKEDFDEENAVCVATDVGKLGFMGYCGMIYSAAEARKAMKGAHRDLHGPHAIKYTQSECILEQLLADGSISEWDKKAGRGSGGSR